MTGKHIYTTKREALGLEVIGDFIFHDGMEDTLELFQQAKGRGWRLSQSA